MKQQRLVIMQGQQAVSNDPNVEFSTLLGSCVAVCLWDSAAEIGGINHILLATHTGERVPCDFEGTNAMELLINAMIKQGGQRNRFTAKVFGGARMVSGLSDIGAANAEFVLGYLNSEGIVVKGKSLGGTDARQLLYRPVAGIARVKSVVAQEPCFRARADNSIQNGVEVF